MKPKPPTYINDVGIKSLDLGFFDSLSENIPIGVCVWDPKLRYLKINRFLATLHQKNQEDFIGRTINEAHPNSAFKLTSILNKILETQEPQFGVKIDHSGLKLLENQEKWVNNFYPIIENDQVKAIMAIITETDNKRLTEILKHKALYDSLTDLPNRNYLKDLLSDLIERDETPESNHAVMFLDLDRFKFINDTLGHAVGDKLLTLVAARLKHNMRGSDVVGRLGGDEFMIILRNIKGSQDTINVAKKILRSMRPPFRFDSQSLHVTTSIGISMYPLDGGDSEMLLRNADISMYRAKEKGGNTYELYAPTMNTKAHEELTLENDLREALDKNELKVYYQPQIDITSREIVGVEALAHWLHPKLGLILPSEFISLAEKTGLIVPLGHWLIRTSFLQLRNWQNQGFKKLKLAINLSDRQLKDPKIVKILTTAIKEADVSPKSIELELTENILINNAERAISDLNKLKSQGFLISIDDFGTGYSSFSYLKRFPVNSLKIDKDFIQNCITDQNDAAIVTAIVSMAHRLNLKVVAEGVETKKQYEFLKTLGCDEFQGYLFSMPVPEDRISEFLKDNIKLAMIQN